MRCSLDRTHCMAPVCRRHGISEVYAYGAEFYRFLGCFAVQSARRVVPKLRAVLPVRSVVDFGCGQGAWLSVWEATGASVTGVDGPYIDAAGLLINPGDFRTADLAGPIELGRQFDLAQSLEVAEHLPPTKAEQFVDTLTAHGSYVLFSAAVPGQGGENHVNEQPLGYWRALFRRRGYAAIDYLRPLIFDDPAVARWYRCNIMLYVKHEVISALPHRVRACRVPDDQPLADYWPLPYRLGHALVRQLPRGAVDNLSRTKGAVAAAALGCKWSLSGLRRQADLERHAGQQNGIGNPAAAKQGEPRPSSSSR
jgi:SAM-dependent methyltransferase